MSGPAFLLNLFHAHEKASPTLYDCPKPVPPAGGKPPADGGG
jgi:hypothetical protein